MHAVTSVGFPSPSLSTKAGPLGFVPVGAWLGKSRREFTSYDYTSLTRVDWCDKTTRLHSFHSTREAAVP